MEKQWGLSECVQAEIWLEEAVRIFQSGCIANLNLKQMLLYCRSARLAQTQRGSGPHLPGASTVTVASRAQARGFAGLSSLTATRRTASLPSTSNPSTSRSSTPLSTSALPVSVPTPSAEQVASQDAADAARDLAAVKSEIYRWKQAPLRTMDEKFDLVCFLEVNHPIKHALLTTDVSQQAIETEFPLMFKVALDILPVQASSVSCERIFSSSKETCAMRRNLLSPALLEVLQVLKHVYKQGRLDFTSHLITTEEDYSIERVTEEAINELVSLGKTDELLDLLRSMEESDSTT
jgi:hypothetical protein